MQGVVGQSTGEAGIGVSLLRKEDDRFLRGRGEFVADVRLPGTLEIAFLRSPLAHARIRRLKKPAGSEGRVFTHDDLAEVAPIRAVAGLPGVKPSEQPVLATGKVRHVGEIVVMCVAETRAAAEDLAAEVDVAFDELQRLGKLENLCGTRDSKGERSWADERLVAA